MFILLFELFDKLLLSESIELIEKLLSENLFSTPFVEELLFNIVLFSCSFLSSSASILTDVTLNPIVPNITDDKIIYLYF